MMFFGRTAWVATWLAAALSLGAAGRVAQAEEGAWLMTDKDDYAPGELALIAGGGFWPGEYVDVSIAINDPVTEMHIGDYDYTGIEVDDSGSFLLTYTVPPEAAGMNLIATALGMSSGLIATAEFTDNHFTLVGGSITALGNTLSIEVEIGGGSPFPDSVDAIVGGGLSDISVTLAFNSTTSLWEGSTAGAYSTTYFIRHVHVKRSGGENKNFNNQSVITQTATTSDPPPPPQENSPPVIVNYDPCIDLGQICGELGVGELGFGHKVDLAYDWDVDEDGVVSVYVTAWLHGNPYPALLATITDADGDEINVAVDGPDCTTLSGPGSQNVTFPVVISANDGEDEAEEDGVSLVKIKAQLEYNFSGFDSPLGKAEVTVVKGGSTVPVKFKITDCNGAPIDIGAHRICVDYHSAVVPSTKVTVNDSGSSNDNGNLFRYSDGKWIYNLSTKTGYVVGSTYRITAKLDDGTTYSVCISIK